MRPYLKESICGRGLNEANKPCRYKWGRHTPDKKMVNLRASEQQRTYWQPYSRGRGGGTDEVNGVRGEKDMVRIHKVLSGPSQLRQLRMYIRSDWKCELKERGFVV